MSCRTPAAHAPFSKMMDFRFLIETVEYSGGILQIQNLCMNIVFVIHFSRLGYAFRREFLASVRGSSTSSAVTRTHVPLLKAQISHFGSAAICLETSLFLPV